MNEKLVVDKRQNNDEKSKLKESVAAHKQEAEFVIAETLRKKELQEARETIDKMKEIQNRSDKETKVLRVNLEEQSISDKSALKNVEDQVKLKNQEIKSLVLTRKISVDNATKPQIANKKLEKDMEELKLNKTSPIDEIKLPYPCDKWNFTFKSAALSIKHVKKEHGNTPVRP
jgi:hypothetical protein